MAWFKKAAQSVNEHYDVATELQVALAPTIRRVRRLEELGTPANGVITGILFSLNDSTTRKEFAVTALRPEGWRRFGVRTQPNEAHRLRLGMPVVLKVDGDRAILDWEAMARAWGLAGQTLTQESLRKPPDDGIVDNALDARVQRHLAKWTPVQATIVSLQRRSMMGMPTLNWDIDLRLPDGSVARSGSDEVPTYAQWYAAPGATAPIVVNPKDAREASIDWPAFAIALADTAGFDDDPPAGSIAAEIEAARSGRGVSGTTVAGVGSVSSGTAGQPTPPPPSSAGAPVALDATLRAWVDARRGGHMSEKDFENALKDWQAAGMCTAPQAEAARTAAG